MIKINLKLALRHLWNDQTNTYLSIVGLSVAFAAAFLLGLYSLYELSTDRFHHHVNSIYKVYNDEQTSKGTRSTFSHPVPFAEALKNEVPGIKKITRHLTGNALLSQQENTFKVKATWVDPDFLEIFSFPISEGEKKNPLNHVNSVILSKKMAQTLFPNEPPIGKTVNMQKSGENVLLIVTGVFEEISAANSMFFDAVFNFKNLPDETYASNLDRWDNQNHSVYVMLDPNMRPEQFEKATHSFSELHYREPISVAKRDGAQPNTEGNYRQLKLLPLADQHFAFNKNGRLEVDKTLQYAVLGIAVLILFIASVNFINMSLAKIVQRLREIGIRKTLGGQKTGIFFQFWSESLIIFGIAVILGFLIAFALIKPLQTLLNSRASFAAMASPTIIIGLLFIILLITFVAGGYPALLMSRFNTMQAAKGKLETKNRNKLRNALIIVQFAIAIFLISSTLILWKQLAYLRSMELGYNKEQVISFPLNTRQAGKKALEVFRNELHKNPAILSVTASMIGLGLGKDGNSITSIISFDYQNRQLSPNMFIVDYDYPETLDIALVQGRSFSRSHPSDSLSVMINEAMAKELGTEDISQVQLALGDSLTNFKVIGVLKDFNFQGPRKQIDPAIFFLGDSSLNFVFVKVDSTDLLHSYDFVEQVWTNLEPDLEFLGSFLDENIERSLRQERNLLWLIGSGSIVAIILSCFGLLALSLLVVTQRQKEIGIRKVLGASVATLMLLLTKDFIKLVVLAFFIAAPITWYCAKIFLDNYIYRIDLGIFVFLVAGSLAFLISILTIGFGTVRAALKNPVESIKVE